MVSGEGLSGEGEGMGLNSLRVGVRLQLAYLPLLAARLHL